MLPALHLPRFGAGDQRGAVKELARLDRAREERAAAEIAERRLQLARWVEAAKKGGLAAVPVRERALVERELGRRASNAFRVSALLAFRDFKTSVPESLTLHWQMLLFGTEILKVIRAAAEAVSAALASDAADGDALENALTRVAKANVPVALPMYVSFTEVGVSSAPSTARQQLELVYSLSPEQRRFAALNWSVYFLKLDRTASTLAELVDCLNKVHSRLFPKDIAQIASFQPHPVLPFDVELSDAPTRAAPKRRPRELDRNGFARIKRN